MRSDAALPCMRDANVRVPTVPEIVDALLIFTEPIMNSRYHAMLFRRNISGRESDLGKIPSLVLESARDGREGALRWALVGEAAEKDEELFGWAEHTILDSFLSLAEAQLPILAHLARRSPSAEVRAYFDKMAATHREMAHTLREALKAEPYPPQLNGAPDARRSVQEEEPTGDFRGQLEKAVRTAHTRGGVRRILLSHIGFRHLRDQGLFRDRESRFQGVPVVIDMGWDAPVFVLETYDQVPLEEIMDHA